MLFSELYEIIVNRVTFVGFKEDDRPNRPPPGSNAGPQTVDSQHSGGLFSEWVIHELAIEDYNILT